MKLFVKTFVLALTAVVLVSCSETKAPQNTWTDAKKYPLIIAMGDSLTAGYWLPIEDSYPAQLEKLLQDNGYKYRVRNAWTSGDTSAQLLEKTDFILGGELPSLAIVVIGGNDLLQSLPPDGLKANLSATVKKLQEKGIPVAIASLSAPLNVWAQYRSAFKQAYESVSEEMNVPLYPSFLSGVFGNSSLMLGDNIHPNKEGYAIIAKNMMEFLEGEGLISK